MLLLCLLCNFSLSDCSLLSALFSTPTDSTSPLSICMKINFECCGKVCVPPHRTRVHMCRKLKMSFNCNMCACFACWKLVVLSVKNHLENFVRQHSKNEDLCSILSILICISSKIFVALLDCLSSPPQHSAFRSPSFVHKDLSSTKRIISQLRVNKYRSKPKNFSSSADDNVP